MDKYNVHGGEYYETRQRDINYTYTDYTFTRGPLWRTCERRLEKQKGLRKAAQRGEHQLAEAAWGRERALAGEAGRTLVLWHLPQYFSLFPEVTVDNSAYVSGPQPIKHPPPESSTCRSWHFKWRSDRSKPISGRTALLTSAVPEQLDLD